MEILTIDGKDYVKASKLAREFGYTSDYIGQLCRAEKVDAQLVGRSWYVHRDSLEDHKEGLYKKKSTILEGKVISPTLRRSNTATHLKTDKSDSSVYDVDEYDLIPTPKKPSIIEDVHKLSVKLAKEKEDAEKKANLPEVIKPTLQKSFKAPPKQPTDSIIPHPSKTNMSEITIRTDRVIKKKARGRSKNRRHDSSLKQGSNIVSRLFYLIAILAAVWIAGATSVWFVDEQNNLSSRIYFDTDNFNLAIGYFKGLK